MSKRNANQVLTTIPSNSSTLNLDRIVHEMKEIGINIRRSKEFKTENVFEISHQLPLEIKLRSFEEVVTNLTYSSFEGVIDVRGDFGFPNYNHFQQLKKLKLAYPRYAIIVRLNSEVEGGLSLNNRSLLLSALDEVDAIIEATSDNDLNKYSLDLPIISIDEDPNKSINSANLNPHFIDLNNPEMIINFKRENLLLVVITGTYNIFHPNHLSYIQTVRQMYPKAKIVIGLDEEKWADERKPGRKRQSLILRAATIAALFPDITFVAYNNNSVTNESLIRTLTPCCFLISRSTSQELPLKKQNIINLAQEFGVCIGVMPAAELKNNETPISSTFLESSIDPTLLPNLINKDEES